MNYIYNFLKKKNKYIYFTKKFGYIKLKLSKILILTFISTLSNYFVTISNMLGHVFFHTSTGSAGFSTIKKTTAPAVTAVLDIMIKKIFKLKNKLKTELIILKIKNHSKFKLNINLKKKLLDLQQNFKKIKKIMKIVGIVEATTFSHNGLKLKKSRRV